MMSSYLFFKTRVNHLLMKTIWQRTHVKSVKALFGTVLMRLILKPLYSPLHPSSWVIRAAVWRIPVYRGVGWGLPGMGEGPLKDFCT